MSIPMLMIAKAKVKPMFSTLFALLDPTKTSEDTKIVWKHIAVSQLLLNVHENGLPVANFTYQRQWLGSYSHQHIRN
jgi:hypothetical protein